MEEKIYFDVNAIKGDYIWYIGIYLVAPRVFFQK